MPSMLYSVTPVMSAKNVMKMFSIFDFRYAKRCGFNIFF
ncbi:hypothetical protein [Klebsiella pneumoniae ISC21]|nr:hypothetical protein [Klebsiella pneumoniae ISC21]